MATWGELEQFTFKELEQFRYIELTILNLNELKNRLSDEQQQLPCDLSDIATKNAKKYNFPKIANLTDFINFVNAVLKLLLTATGQNNVSDLLSLVSKVTAYFSSLK